MTGATGELSPHTQACDCGFLLFIPVHHFRLVLRWLCCLRLRMAFVMYVYKKGENREKYRNKKSLIYTCKRKVWLHHGLNIINLIGQVALQVSRLVLRLVLICQSQVHMVLFILCFPHQESHKTGVNDIGVLTFSAAFSSFNRSPPCAAHHVFASTQLLRFTHRNR